LRREWQAVGGVEVLGHVEDLAAVYAKSRAVVVPMYDGGGTKIKVLEALAHNRCVLLTRYAHRGYEHTLHSDVHPSR
jgi:glycosyltransferase involved in cell wall biosynthesis